MPMAMAEAIAANFPGAEPRRDWLVQIGQDGIPTLVHWDAKAMGRAKPNRATLERWMNAEVDEAALAKRRDKVKIRDLIGRKGSAERAQFRWMMKQINAIRDHVGMTKIKNIDEALEDMLPELNAED